MPPPNTPVAPAMPAGDDVSPPILPPAAGPDKTPASAAAAMAAASAGLPVPLPKVDFLVEFGDQNNRSYRWPVRDMTVRGWWKKTNILRSDCDERFAPMPDTPGIQLRVNTGKRQIAYKDPLARAENAELMDKVAAVMLSAFGEKVKPVDPVVLDNVNDNDIKNTLYWVRRFLDAGQCAVVTGSVPTMDEIRYMPGTIPTSSFDVGFRGKMPRAIPDDYQAPNPNRKVAS